MVFDKIKDIIVEQLDVEEDAVTMGLLSQMISALTHWT